MLASGMTAQGDTCTKSNQWRENPPSSRKSFERLLNSYPMILDFLGLNSPGQSNCLARDWELQMEACILGNYVERLYRDNIPRLYKSGIHSFTTRE
jgi:hypothetical protein